MKNEHQLKHAEAAIDIFVAQQMQCYDQISEVLGYKPDSINPISGLMELIEYYEKRLKFKNVFMISEIDDSEPVFFTDEKKALELARKMNENENCQFYVSKFEVDLLEHDAEKKLARPHHIRS